MALLLISSLVLPSLLNAGLFETLEKQTDSNAANCAKLNTSETLCKQAGACMWAEQTGCFLDPCFRRTVLADSCGASPCARLQLDGANTTFCITQSRFGEFTTPAQICTLEWGEYKAIEMAACQSLIGCGPLTKVAGIGESFYVCQEGKPPADPCVNLPEDVCSYVGLCMWDGGCVQDPCWERTYTSLDSCRDGCSKHKINPNGTPEFGYCKTGNNDLASVCNAGTATNIATKLGVCTFMATNIPSECSKVVTISKFDGDDYYVCNNEELEFTVAGAISMNSFGVALSTLIFLFFLF